MAIVTGGSFTQNQKQPLDFEQLLFSTLEKEKGKGNYVLRTIFVPIDRDAIQENNISPNTTRFQDSPQLQGIFQEVEDGKYAIALDERAVLNLIQNKKFRTVMNLVNGQNTVVHGLGDNIGIIQLFHLPTGETVQYRKVAENLNDFIIDVDTPLTDVEITYLII